MKYIHIYRLLIPAACIFCSGTACAQWPNPLPKLRHDFIVVSHRGDHTHAPENTLAAFANAVAAGADYVEIDLRTTVDSQLVIMHDASVNRMTDDTGLVRNMTWEKLHTLKVKDKAHPEWGEQEIPLFTQVLDLCKGRIYIYLDFKNADPAAAWREIVKRGMEKEVVVYINAPHQFYEWRKVAPAMPLMVSLPSSVRGADSLTGFLNKYHPDILDGDFDEYTPEMIKAAAALGVMVLPDIQRPGENAALWATAIQKGLQGLQTDHPADLVVYLKTQGIR
ncbi:MAG TPA: glycerophosphodiester phosphodiesterase family protein [Puia sp.]|jgi:glycerophosphoryl diester phosphodiesterase|nr:glycerophosphodiester phosphodiesterase family protein [Puia sp.]